MLCFVFQVVSTRSSPVVPASGVSSSRICDRNESETAETAKHRVQDPAPGQKVHLSATGGVRSSVQGGAADVRAAEGSGKL